MPPRRNHKRKPQYTNNYSTATLKKQKKSLIKRLLEISIALDGHIYSNERLTTAAAVKYFEEITSYKLENCTDERILQVREKLLRCMTGVIIEDKPETHQDIAKASEDSCSLINRPNIVEDVHQDSDMIIENHSTPIAATETNDITNRKTNHGEKCSANFGNDLYDKMNLTVTKVDRVLKEGNIHKLKNIEIVAVDKVCSYSEPNNADISKSQVNIEYKDQILEFCNQDPPKIQTCSQNNVEKCNETAITNNFENNLHNEIHNLHITEVHDNISIEGNINSFVDIEKAASNNEATNSEITSKNSTSIFVASNKEIDFSKRMKSRFEDPIKKERKTNSNKKYNASKKNSNITKNRKVVPVEKYRRDDNEISKRSTKNILKAATKVTKDICVKEHLDKTVKKRKRAPADSTNSNRNKNTEDLTWVDDFKYVRVVTDEEFDTTNFTEDFWSNLDFPPDWNDDFNLPL